MYLVVSCIDLVSWMWSHCRQDPHLGTSSQNRDVLNLEHV